MISALERLRDLTQQKLDILNKMLRMYYIADLLDVHPGAINEKVRTYVELSPNPRKPWVSATFVIQVGDTTTMVPLVDVPYELWPQDVLKEYKRAG